MSAPSAQTLLASELWVSFAALLRSYIAVARQNSGEAPKIAMAGDSLAVVADQARLEVRYDAEVRAGSWRLRGPHQEETRGRFELLPEGSIALGGEILDLDHAAINLATALMEAGAKSPRREP